jgi:hypothetical protein
MAPILAPILGVHFFRGHISLKNRPLLATIQPVSKTCAFLFKKRSEGCFVWAAPSLLLARGLLHNCPFQLSFSWELDPARQNRCKVAKCYPRGGYF